MRLNGEMRHGGDNRELLAAAEPFRRALEIIDALPPGFRPADNSALREYLPGVWPTVGELRKLTRAIT